MSEQARGREARSPLRGGFCWNSLLTNDAAQSRDFYEQLFGWTSVEVDMGDAGTCHVLKNEGGDVASVLQALPTPEEDADADTPHWVGYVEVEDVAAAAERARALGGTIDMPSTKLPVGWFALVSDPLGARFGLFRPTNPDQLKTDFPGGAA